MKATTTRKQALMRSRGRYTTKIHFFREGNGHPRTAVLSPGQAWAVKKLVLPGNANTTFFFRTLAGSQAVDLFDVDTAEPGGVGGPTETS